MVDFLEKAGFLNSLSLAIPDQEDEEEKDEDETPPTDT